MIEHLEHHGHRLWMMDDEPQPAKYVRRRLTQQHTTPVALQIMRDTPVTIKRPTVPLTILIHKTKIVGYEVPTWVGKRYGTSKDVNAFLRRDGYTQREINSIYALARRERVSDPEAIQVLVAYGIRP